MACQTASLTLFSSVPISIERVTNFSILSTLLTLDVAPATHFIVEAFWVRLSPNTDNDLPQTFRNWSYHSCGQNCSDE